MRFSSYCHYLYIPALNNVKAHSVSAQRNPFLETTVYCPSYYANICLIARKSSITAIRGLEYKINVADLCDNGRV